METVAKRGADIVLLPELATTGFTGKIARLERRAVAEHIRETIDQLKNWVTSKGIAVTFGSTLFPSDSSAKPINAMITFLPDGTSYVDEKIHAKEGKEEEFFEKGSRRQGFRYGGLKFDFVICREFRIYDEAVSLISKDTSVVFWPGCIRHNTGDDTIDNLNVGNICAFAEKNGVHVVASNWANFLDRDPNRPGNMGGSYVATPRGKVSNRCKWDEEDFIVFDYE